MLGAGYWAATALLPAVAARDDVELVVVSRRNGDAARRIAEHFGAATATDDWRAALELGLDAVVVASPPVAHEDQVTAALRSGAHVLCEKPFAMDAAAAWRMVAEAEDAGRNLLVGFGWNYMPPFRNARRLVEGIGPVEYVGIELRVPVRDLFESGSVASASLDLVSRESATFVDPAISAGGHLAGNLSHAFGLAWYLTRLEALDVACRLHRGAIGADVHGGALVGYEQSATGVVTGASTHTAGGDVEWSVTVVGRDGQVGVDWTAGTVWSLRGGGPAKRETVAEADLVYRPAAPLAELIAVARGAAPGDAASAALGARTTAIVEAAYRSESTGCRERVPGRIPSREGGRSTTLARSPRDPLSESSRGAAS